MTRILILNADPDPEAMKFKKMLKKIWFPSLL
jgi:hypothetical protein